MFYEDQDSMKKRLDHWTALENEGMGAALQYDNPFVDDEVNKEWNIPDSCKLKCRLRALCRKRVKKHSWCKDV
ncbi:hypothetical protein AXI59_14265 [Bacillus nakamurai]|nr:hypothetical protein AXI59_14265 [Bacillus nakamurai]